MAAYVYGRVSGKKQKASGAGEAAQDDDCVDFAARSGLTIAGVHLEEEDVKGDKPLHKRPALIKALAAMRRGDVLIVAKRDRLGRDPYMVMAVERELAAKGCRLLSAAGEGTADDAPESIFQRRIMDAFAELERFRIKVRTKAAAAAKRRRGQRVGQSPFGWEPDPDGPRHAATGRLTRLRPVPAEQTIVRQIEAWRAEGWTLRAIAATLNAQAVPTKRRRGSDRWTHTTVDSILRTCDAWREHAAPPIEPALSQ